MILAKKINFRHSVPLRFGPEKNHKKASYRTNKQDFLHLSLSKALYYYNCLLVGLLEKKYYLKHWKNVIFCFPLKSLFFVLKVLYMGLGGSNLKILTPEMDHMAENCQNYWFPTKTHHVKKKCTKNL